jgi:hypothetical protein
MSGKKLAGTVSASRSGNRPAGYKGSEVSLSPSSYTEAQASYKPMKRSAIKRGSPLGRTTRRTIKRKVKKPKVSTLKKKAWHEFSIFIRTRRADEHGFVNCVTCGARKHWKTVDAGHFLAGRLNNNLFDERGCNEQCKNCNGPRAGNGAMYYRWMSANHGEAVIDELIRLNDQTHKWQPGELEAIAAKYKALNDANPLCQE